MPIAIDHPAVKEQVRTLYYANGRNLSDAARTAGIPIDRAEKWKERGNWDNVTSTLIVSESVGRVADNVAATLQARKQESRAKLSEYQVRAATEAAAHGKPLSITRQVNDLASIHSKVWPEDQSKPTHFTLNQLNINSLSVDETPTLD